MNSKIIGGLLLIIGTSIGGGMLALPIANSAHGFFPSIVYLIFCWFIMLQGAFYILEANMQLPAGKDMVSMAAATLGPWGLITSWITYMALLYSLLAAYLSGGTDLFINIFKNFTINIPNNIATGCFLIIFGTIVYSGIKSVDLVNRILMFAKLAIYCILIAWIGPNSNTQHFTFSTFKPYFSDLMIMITAFGFAIIIPNLRVYFNDDLKLLKKIIFWGSVIPLLCYILWDATIMGAIPVSGSSSLISLIHNPQPTSSLANLLSIKLNNNFVLNLFNAFTSICMLTAFLGVGLCLKHFLADGLKLQPKGKEGIILFLLTFLPPAGAVLLDPGIYIAALDKAGIFCTILLLLIPALMVIKIRYRQNQLAKCIAPGILVIFSALFILIQIQIDN